ncbi:type I pullulanase [Bacillus massiliglaciei]|uniref:type I pullulanase n=1 Tax=Bacillus massiliglaciei TaxID=1816693 RepID=UPI000B180896|nr:type I pullulanase [Bacillus massiliglaciei]
MIRWTQRERNSEKKISRGESVIKNQELGKQKINNHSIKNRNEEMDKTFFYSGNDLGYVYKKNQTSFRVWAPTAEQVNLVIYDSEQGSKGKEIEMNKAEQGTWHISLPGDMDGTIYMYKIKFEGNWSEAVDPYTRAVTVNGERGVVLDLSNTNPSDWKKEKPPLNHFEDAIIYELHIRDSSIHPKSGIQHKGKFLGLTETDTKGPSGYPTGLAHIKDMGVTHVQLLPIFDYATVDESSDKPQYNWGYDPKNYNVPEGSYSSDPFNPKSRIKELKQLIQTFHNNGIRVIMDVVYNHVHSVEDSSFEKIVPGYFFRYDENGCLSNGTGVGNDTASERKMMRKFMIDSVTYWAEEFHIDGFRFDLMGIHDIETMNGVREALDQIDPSIILLGEGWDLNTPLPEEKKANQKNADKMERIAHFNDIMRDSLKGSALDEHDTGIVNGKQGVEDIIKKSIMGGLEYDRKLAAYHKPEQVINYCEAHDNHTLWDKLSITNPEASLDEKKKRHKLATSIVLLSQGIPFLHAGQEFMRTKGGDHNSYKSSDSVNWMDWNRRAEFAEEAEYVKGLIKLRKKFKAFRYNQAEEIKEHLSFTKAEANIIAYTLRNPSESEKVIFVIHNANQSSAEIDLPTQKEWLLLADESRAGTEELNRVKGPKISVPALATLVLAEA